MYICCRLIYSSDIHDRVVVQKRGGGGQDWWHIFTFQMTGTRVWPKGGLMYKRRLNRGITA